MAHGTWHFHVRVCECVCVFCSVFFFSLNEFAGLIGFFCSHVVFHPCELNKLHINHTPGLKVLHLICAANFD